MKCKDCAYYKDEWCSMVTDSPDPDMERDCGHFIRAQRWIPVEERLPHDFESVVVIASGRPNSYVELYYSYELGYHNGFGWRVNAYPNWDNPIVSHWMPLPEPPEVSEP